MEGYISLSRKILEWEWYGNNNVKVLFLHCLIKANFKAKKWQGITINRGQFITSYGNLSKELNISVQQVRTALDKLVLTNEIKTKTTNKNTLVTVVKYNDYQNSQQTNNKQITIKQQTNNNQITTTNNDNKDNNDNKENNINDLFNIFWSKYPNKVAKQNAKKIFLKLTQKEIDKILLTLDDFVNYKPFKEYNHPNPTTYLNQKRWEDELKTKKQFDDPTKNFTL